MLAVPVALASCTQATIKNGGHDGPTCSDAAACDDGNACTIDTCSGSCWHAPAVDGTPCAATDPCTAAERCEAGECLPGAPSLDLDEDGHTIELCGGDDCDDADAAIHPGAIEGGGTCADGLDNDCDGLIDALDPGCGAVDPTCVPRDDVTDPIQPTASIASTCTAPTACGGSLAGTSWKYSSICFDQEDLFPGVYAACPASQLNGIGGLAMSGEVAFTATVMTHKLTLTGDGVFQVPVSCASCDCVGYREWLQTTWGVTNAFCYMDCYPDNSCRCLIPVDITIDDSQTYTASGTTLTTADSQTFDYCATTDGLDLTETTAPPLFTGSSRLLPPAAMATPEICDGIDNDLSGTVDDDPVDCPPACNIQGVCADLVVECTGAYGWQCNYRSPYRETGDETRCDGLDNDCDGQVDEGLVGCVELCDGLDNDNNGTIDDNPVGSTCPSLRGVCALGVTPTCHGAAGWTCVYTATAHQEVETLCDGLDNDCDGLVDEGCNCVTGQSKVFVMEHGTNSRILRANLDGTGVETVVDLTGLGQFTYYLQVDSQRNQLYYHDGVGKRLIRTNLDGASPTVIWSGETQQWALDPSDAKGFVENNYMSLLAFDFATPATMVTLSAGASAAAIATDPWFRRVYWWQGFGLQGIDYDGAHFDAAVAAIVYNPMVLLVDTRHDALYWTTGLGVHVSKMNGDDERMIVESSGAYTAGLAIDEGAGKLYYIEKNTDRLQRVGLDGTGVETVLSVTHPEGFDLYLCQP
jgi:hypothetical protein